MSIVVQHLTKEYGTQIAVNNLNFEVHEGEILGFLGPNGAGKSTTMKMITGFLLPTSGQISVGGYNPITHPIEVKSLIGYLPEHNPLYLDLYVKEYLQFVAHLRKLPNANSAILAAIERTGLGLEQHKKIGQLSKGYRQRVGLAQAIIHDPKILILDEPTSGLDPNQLHDIRTLIQELGKEKTLIFSTHIMQEVEAVCDRVLILNRGNLVANDTVKQMKQQQQGLCFVVVFSDVVSAEELARIVGVKKVSYHIELKEWTILAEKDISKDLFDFAVHKQVQLLKNVQMILSLEEVFRQLTAKN